MPASSYETVLREAQSLPQVEQARLISDLWKGLPEDEFVPLDDEWLDEVRHRSAEVDAGLTTIPWMEVRRQAIARVASHD